MNRFPVARQNDLIVYELPDETLVYDQTTDEAHCLNQTASLIWKNCDGLKTTSEIAKVLESQFASPVSENLVAVGIEELSFYRLLDEETIRTRATRPPRREAIRKLGLTAAIALPLITSIVAPTAAHAATIEPCTEPTGRPDGCPCTADSQCASFNCNVLECGPEL